MSNRNPGVKALLTLPLVTLMAFAGCDGNHKHRGGPVPFNPDAPTVSSTTPPDGESGVAINSRATATFSEAMDAATISESTFQIAGAGAGTVTYDAASRIATFVPPANLTATTAFTATITTGARDLAGNALASNYVWTFTTGATADTTVPAVVGTTPANAATNVATNGKLTVTFSEPVDPSTVNASTFLVADGVTIAGTVTYSDAGRTATFDPTSDLAPNTPFTATITTGVKDLAGNALAASFVWTFTTGATADTTNPTVTLLNPTDLATNVFINKRANATFSEAMDPATITTASYRLTGPNEQSVLGTVAYDALERIGTFIPSSNLAPNTQYTAILTTAIADVAGNHLSLPFTWTFTTGTAISPLTVNLRSAAAFSILGGSTVTNVPNVGTIINGDLGVSPGSAVTGFPPGVVNGAIHANTLIAGIAQGDLTTAYNDAKGRTLAPILVAGNLGGQTLAPGLYKSSGSIEVSSGDLTLDAQGDATGIFIFQIATTLSTTPDRKVFLIRGAKASNIFWQVGTSATLDTTTIFKGTIMADQAITMNAGATLDGRALARIAAVALSNNVVTKPAQ